MPAVGTELIYELIVSGDDGNIPFSNSFYYWNDDPTPSDPAAAELISEFGTVVLGEFLALVNEAQNYTLSAARRLNNITDFAEVSYSVFGTVVGDRAASFNAFHLQRFRTTKETRSGWINVMGVSEADTNPGGNGITGAAQIRMQAVATALEATLTPTINTFRPVLVGNKYDYTQDPPLLKPEGTWDYQLISSWGVGTRLSPQTSRQ